MQTAADHPEAPTAIRHNLGAIFISLELIPALINQNLCAQSRSAMDMILHGWSTSLFHASQQWSTISS
jgi:hypothetical protein